MSVLVDAMGDACPIPVIKAKKALSDLAGPGKVEVLVDNETAVRNLTRMGQDKGCQVRSEKMDENKFMVIITTEKTLEEDAQEALCIPQGQKNTVVVISSDKMGSGNDELGSVLIKGFIYALTQLDDLPKTMLFYNGGATITCQGSQSLEDLKSLEAQGVEILTCGTCLNYYGMTDKLSVGSVTNMYAIAEKMSQASLIIKP